MKYLLRPLLGCLIIISCSERKETTTNTKPITKKEHKALVDTSIKKHFFKKKEWENGSVFRYQFTETETSSAGELSINRILNYTIGKIDSAGIDIKVVLSKTTIPKLKKDTSIFHSIFSMTDSLPIVIKLNSYGNYLSCANYDTIKSTFFDRYRVLQKKIKENYTGTNQSIKLSYLLKQRSYFNDTEQFESLFIEKVMAPFYSGGTFIGKNMPSQKSAPMINPVTNQFEVQQINQVFVNAYTDNTLEYYIEQKLNKDSVIAIIKKNLPKDQEIDPAQLSELNYDYYLRIKYQYDRNRQIPKQVDFTKSISNNGVLTSIKYEWVLGGE